MKKVFLVLVMLLPLGGCAGGVHSSLVDMNMDVSLPFLGDDSRQAVVFPYQSGAAGGDAMVRAYGPEWRSVEGDYPDYRFNP